MTEAVLELLRRRLISITDEKDVYRINRKYFNGQKTLYLVKIYERRKPDKAATQTSFRMSLVDAFPLQWPVGRPRTRLAQNSRFEQTNGRAISFTLHQIQLLGGRNAVISSNIQLRQDGLPYANRRRPDDAGVAVYFTYKSRQMCFACDKWLDVYDNIYALERPSKRYAASSAGEPAIWSSRHLPGLSRYRHQRARMRCSE